jgi:hypothetical protein
MAANRRAHCPRTEHPRGRAARWRHDQGNSSQ